MTTNEQREAQRTKEALVRERIAEAVERHGGRADEIVLEPVGRDVYKAKISNAVTGVDEYGVFKASDLGVV